MIAILYQDGYRDVAEKTAQELVDAFSGRVSTAQIAADSPGTWPAPTSWDDLLIVLFDGKDYPTSGNAFIADYLDKRPETALVLPVALNASSRKPPEAAAAIKALPYDTAAPGLKGRLVNRAGGMLGLRLQGRDNKIFLSYRATDGAPIAKQLHNHLLALGHRPFLDEAPELDGDTKILPGTPVQKQIDEALANANLLLLIDTPAAPASTWIKHEVNTADSLLLPILPLCFRDSADSRQGPRFRSLLELQRWIPLQLPAAGSTSPLTAVQLDQIVDAAEKYLCEIFQRKCRVPFLVEKEFVSKGFAWKVLDKRLLMFESKRGSMRLETKVLSHCSLFDQIYSPAIKRFCDFLGATDRGNYSLFIYDGDLLTTPQLQELVESQPGEVIILHHQELAALIDSNFTKLGTA